MPIEVELPDGSIAEFPDGTPRSVMEGALRQHAKTNWKPRQRSPQDLRDLGEAHSLQNPVTQDMGALETFGAGVGKSLSDTGRGVMQFVNGTTDESRAETDRIRLQDEALMGSKAGIAGHLAGQTGQMLVPLGTVAKGLSWANAGRNAAQGAAFAGLQPVGTDESRGLNAAIGAGAGAASVAVPAIAEALGKRAQAAISPQVRALYEAAKARGISLTPAQLSDSRFVKFLASQLQMLPGSGAAAKSAAQREAMNRQLAMSIGEDAPVVTREVYAKAKARQSAKFEELTSRNDARVTPQTMAKLEDVIREAEVVGGQTLDSVRAAVDNFYSRAVTGPKGIVVPGKAYQALDSTLGKATKAGDTTAHFVGQVRNVIREAMDDSISAQDRKAWNALRKEYGNRKTLRDLVAKGDDTGLSPAQLMGRVTANNYGKEAMASGTRGESGDLALIGQRMKEPPSSGTAERMLAGQAFNPFAWPFMAGRVLAGSTAGRALNSDALASLMMREGRGQGLQGLARLLEKPVPQRLIPASVMTAAERKKSRKDRD